MFKCHECGDVDLVLEEGDWLVTRCMQNCQMLDGMNV